MIRLTVKFTGVLLIFLAPLLHAFIKFRTITETEAQEASEIASYGIWSVVMISVMVFFGVAFIYAQIKSQIYNNPFGMVSILFFGGIFLLVTLGASVMLNLILTQAQSNYSVFEDTMTMYIKNSTRFVGYQIAGIILVVSSKFIN